MAIVLYSAPVRLGVGKNCVASPPRRPLRSVTLRLRALRPQLRRDPLGGPTDGTLGHMPSYGGEMARTTEDVLNHHLQCFGASDLAGILSDYTDGAVLFTPTGVLTGPGEMRTLFTTMFAEFTKPGTTFDLIRKDVRGETAFILWKAETADNMYEFCSDTFLVRDGKIGAQTFAGKITPKR